MWELGEEERWEPKGGLRYMGKCVGRALDTMLNADLVC